MMSALLTCPSCGNISEVDGLAPGSAVRCPHCSNPMIVPAVPEPRLMHAPPAGGLLGGADTFICSTCGGSFGHEFVYDQGGSYICHDCYQIAQAPGESAPFMPVVPSAAPTSGWDDSPVDLIPPVPVPSPAQEEPAAPARRKRRSERPAAPVAPSAPVEPAASEEPLHEQASENIDGSMTEATVAEHHESLEGDFPAASRSPAAGGASASPAAARTESLPSWLPKLIIGASAAIVVFGGFMYYSIVHSPTPSTEAIAPTTAPTDETHDVVGGPDQQMTEWEKKNGPRLADWRSEARAMEVSNDLTEAQLRYQKMLALAKTADPPVSNPGIAAELADADSRLRKLSAKIGPPKVVVAFNAAGQAVMASAPTTKPKVDDPLDIPTGPERIEVASSSGHSSGTGSAPEAPVDPSRWEPEHKEELLKLAADAESADRENHSIVALSKLLQIQLTVGDRLSTMIDPKLKEKMIAADEMRRRLLPAARDSDEARALSARSLLAMGLGAEENKKWKTGLDALADASSLMEKALKPTDRYRDPWYLAAQNGLAVANLMQQNMVKAGELFADDEPLGRAAMPMNNPPRTLVWNRAVFDIQHKANILRSVKMLADFVSSHPGDDEPLLNLFGTALFIGDESNPANRKVLDDAIGLYSQRSLDLEKSKPGQRRWGIEWLPEADAQQKYDDYNKAIDEYQDLQRKRAAALSHQKDVEEAVKARRSTPADLKAAKALLEEADKAMKAAHDAIPRPPWVTDPQAIVPSFAEIGVVQASNVVTAAPPPPSAPPPPPPPPPSKVFTPDPNLPQAPAGGAGDKMEGNAATPPAAPGSTPAGQAAGSTPPGAAPAGPVIVPVPLPQVRHAAAFAIDKVHLLTAADAIGAAAVVHLEDSTGRTVPAKVIARSDRLALLEIDSAKLGAALPYMSLALTFEAGPVQCPAVPEASIFSPSVSVIAAEDAAPPVKSIWAVALAAHPRLPGSPLIDSHSQVIGMEIAQRSDSRKKIMAVTLADLQKFLADNHVSAATASARPDPQAVWEVSAKAE